MLAKMKTPEAKIAYLTHERREFVRRLEASQEQVKLYKKVLRGIDKDMRCVKAAG